MSNKINFKRKCLAIFLLTSRKIELQCWDKNAKKENEKSFKNCSQFFKIDFEKVKF